MDLYLMSPPSPSWSFRGHPNLWGKDTPELDARRARDEWLRLAEAIEGLGAKVAVLPPDDELPALPFAAQAGHALPPLKEGGKIRFLLPRMKLEHRKGERDKWKPFVERLGFEAVEIEGGTWEGQGDVAHLGRLVFLFWGVRTDRAGAEAAGKHFDCEQMLIEIWKPAFHGDMALLPLEHARSLVVCVDVIDDDSLALLEARLGRDRLLFVSEEELHDHATSVLPIGDTVLAAMVLPDRVRRLLIRNQLKVVELAMPELCGKAGSSTRRLVCKIDGLPDDFVIPEENRLSTFAREIRG